METKSKTMIEKIEKIVELLKMSDEPDSIYYHDFLAFSLSQLNKPHELNKIAENILKTYGGMATFSDVAILKNGEYLKDMQDEFSQLRTELFLLCEEVIE